MEYHLFGRPIQIKALGCSINGSQATPIPPSINLFVKVTNGCNAHCLFCSNAGYQSHQTFNINKLFDCIDEIFRQKIYLNRLNITGGEPSLVSGLVKNIISRLESHNRYNCIHLHLNTNGFLPESKALMRFPRWDSISISLHHYEGEKLAKIYDCAMPDAPLSFEGVDMDKVNLSCNLMKGYIDSPEEVSKMLDFAIDLGVYRIGFVGLMPINEYCRTHFIDLKDVGIDTIPHVYFTKSKNRGTDCKCSNYLYNKDAKILEIYFRNYMNPQYCESSLVFDGEYLRQGFHNNNIII